MHFKEFFLFPPSGVVIIMEVDSWVEVCFLTLDHGFSVAVGFHDVGCFRQSRET